MAQVLSTKRKQILDCISEAVRERGLPTLGARDRRVGRPHVVLHGPRPSGRAPTRGVPDGGTRPSPGPSRSATTPPPRSSPTARPIRHVPLVGEVAAGTGVLAQENVEELYPLPEDFTGTGTLFMVKVRGDSMIEAGIIDGDCVVVRQQPDAEQGDVVVAGHPRRRGDRQVLLHPGRRGGPHPGQRSGSSPWNSIRTRSPSTARWSPCCAGSDPTAEALTHRR